MKLHSLRFTLVISALAAAVPGAGAAQHDDARPTARDVAGLSDAADPQLSPDGRMVVYILRTRTFDESKVAASPESEAGWTVERQLWIAPADGSTPPRQITFGDKPVSSPRFSPDGRWLAYMRSVDGNARIHLLRISAGPYGGAEPVIVDTGDLQPEVYQFSPDSKRIAFTATPEADADAEAMKHATGGVVRYGEEWRNARLYVVAVEGAGEVTHITDGAEHIIDFAWSPAAHQFAVVVSESADPYYAFSLKTPKLIDAQTGEVVRALEDQPGAIGHIEWSPNLRYIAYEMGDGALSLLNALVVQSTRGGAPVNAARKLDPTLEGFTWTEDGEIVAHVYERTQSRFYRLSPDGEKAELLAEPSRVFGSAFATDNYKRAAVGLSSAVNSPPAPTRINLETGAVNVVANAHDVSDWVKGEVEIVRWQNADGVALEGVLTRTPLRTGGSRAPLMVMPHGGPDSVSTQSFDWRAHYFIARGFNVFRPNYRGGFGYGYDFYRANRGRLGEIEFMDIESGVDHLISAGIADPGQLVYGGWSWGGFCTAYTIAHTNRYKAAVAGAAVTDPWNQYALSDINHGVAAEWEYTGLPWTKPDVYDNASAVRHIDGAATPTLVVHGMADDRVPFGQGVTLYRALKDVGCKVKFLAYPREPHGFREPAHVAHLMQAWSDWYWEHLPKR